MNSLNSLRGWGYLLILINNLLTLIIIQLILLILILIITVGQCRGGGRRQVTHPLTCTLGGLAGRGSCRADEGPRDGQHGAAAGAGAVLGGPRRGPGACSPRHRSRRREGGGSGADQTRLQLFCGARLPASLASAPKTGQTSGEGTGTQLRLLPWN